MQILFCVCHGLTTIDTKGYLHNDLKSDNVVLSDCLPMSKHAPSLWPVIDFGKARSMKFPKMYKLTETEKTRYLHAYTHLARDLVSGLYPQSPATDIYLLGVIIKVTTVTYSFQLKPISKLCVNVPTNRPSMVCICAGIIS